MNKKITFVLPGHSRKPVGGFKVVYEYANRFSEEGHGVNIVFAGFINWKKQSYKEKIKSVCRYVYHKITKKYKPYNWFPLSKKIKLSYPVTLKERNIPEGDIIFATACETSFYVDSYSLAKGKKYYLIQGWENWGCPEEELIKTWKFNLDKIVIAKWLEDKGKELREKTSLVYNGLDFIKFNLDLPITKRDKFTLIMLYHTSPLKGSLIGLKTYEELKKRGLKINLICFGTAKRPKDLPKEMEYYESPTQNLLRELYNRSSIYIGTSYGEGWGLTLSEAMQCGCAVVCTNAEGYKEVAFHGETALLSPIGSEKELADNIEKLIKNDVLRIKLAENGNKFIQRFTWESSYKLMKEVLSL